MFALLPIQAWSAPRIDVNPDSSTTVSHKIITTNTNGAKQEVAVPILIEQSRYFLLPVYRVIRTQVKIKGGDPVDLINTSGRIQLPESLNEDSRVTIIVTIDNLTGTKEGVDQLTHELRQDPEIGGRTFTQVGTPSDEISAILTTKNPNKQLGDAWTFSPLSGDSSEEVEFKCKGSDLLDFDGEAVSRFELTITSRYIAEQTKTSYQLNGTQIHSSLVRLAQRIKSTPGADGAFFIPMDSADVKAGAEIDSAVNDASNILIKKYKGEDAPDAQAIQKFEEDERKRFIQNQDISATDDKTKLVFLLSNGVDLRATMGEVKSFESQNRSFDSFDYDEEHKKAYTSKNTGSSSTGLNFINEDMYLDFNHSGNHGEESTSSFDDTLKTAKKEATEAVRKFTGDVKFFPKVNIDEVNNALSQMSSEDGVTVETHVDNTTNASVSRLSIRPPSIDTRAFASLLKWYGDEFSRITNKRDALWTARGDPGSSPDTYLKEVSAPPTTAPAIDGETYEQRLIGVVFNNHGLRIPLLKPWEFREVKDVDLGKDYIFEAHMVNPEQTASPDGPVEMYFEGHVVLSADGHLASMIIKRANFTPPHLPGTPDDTFDPPDFMRASIPTDWKPPTATPGGPPLLH